MEAITDLKDPSTGTHLRIRVGVHSGAVVGWLSFSNSIIIIDLSKVFMVH